MALDRQGGTPPLYDSMLSDGEAADLARIADAVIDVEDVDELQLMDGERAVLVPLPPSFPDDVDKAPFGDTLQDVKTAHAAEPPPHQLSPSLLRDILGSMGDGYVIDPGLDPRYAAIEATQYLEMDYVHAVLDDGEPRRLVYSGPREYFIVEDMSDSASHSGEDR